jgi:hypothetical protein
VRFSRSETRFIESLCENQKLQVSFFGDLATGLAVLALPPMPSSFVSFAVDKV